MRFDGRSFDKEGVGTCAMQEDGDFAKEDGVFGENDREVLLQSLKGVDNKVDESIC